MQSVTSTLERTHLSENDPHSAESDGLIVNGPSEPPLQYLTLGGLLQQRAEQHPNKLAVVSRWQNTSLTYQALLESSKEVAQSLVIHGVRPSDRVVVLAGNSIEYVQLLFAVGGIGSVFTIINPTFTAEEVIHAVDFIRPRAIFIADRIGYRNNKSLLQDLAGKTDETLLIVQMGSADKLSSELHSWDEFRKIDPQEAQHGVNLVQKYWSQDNVHIPLCIQFTSGTTGPRKAAMLTHDNLINNAYLVGSRLEMLSDDLLCCSPPLFHCFGLVCGPLAVITHSATAIIPSDVFNADASLRACHEEGCTVINAVPTMFQAMLDHATSQNFQGQLRLRTGLIAGASLSETLISRLANEFGLKGLAYAFGMTELSCVSFMTDPSKVSLLEDRSSVGTPLAHTAARVVDENLKTVPAGTRGELLVAGYLVFSGYYENLLKTNETLVQDDQGQSWLRTGDIVTLGQDGACIVVGRSKDMIKKVCNPLAGENIAPSDIEKVLEQHPDIAAAAVVGIPDSRWGETIAAYVHRVPQDKNRSLTSKDIRIWLRKRVAAHKIPDHIFLVGEDAGVPQQLPVNASGKVLKTELSAIAVGLVRGQA